MESSVHVWLAPAGPRAAAHDFLLGLASTLVDRPTLTHDAAGRPHIPGLAVSITYTHHRLAVAASYDGPIGVDLEEIRPRDFRPLADRWFTPRELDWTARQPDRLTAFLRLWTAKEAVGKALGTGLHGSGLRREMPLGGGAVDRAPGVAVTYPPCPGAVLAVAAPLHAGVELSHFPSPTLDPACMRG
ncbi:4'-phosphopantetheinyl transferase superfamily protein [Kribbella sp. HUAS MG21]|uniref:4'-phosphopantetheinyl transferase superfamily protein n=1 Tax=Kribbella sp. HUAS MG21 TaxID=3160966 RepID=A0AAU7TN53_9ACTN